MAEHFAARFALQAAHQAQAPATPPLPPATAHLYVPRGRVLTIAGSDSGGGAGIQADLKTILALGGYGMSAIAALTAQNTLGVEGIHEVPVDFVGLQIDLVVSDLGVDCVKTGMLATPEMVRAVAAKLRHHSLTAVVVDPVMVAKGGASLLSQGAIQAVVEAMLPLATIVTPNVPEAALLLGVPEEDIGSRGLEGLRWACERLHRLGPRHVLVKGGHLPVEPDGLATDVLYDGTTFHTFSGVRRDTAHTHGTGCTCAAAIATGLAQGLSVYDAVHRAKRYVTTAIWTNPGLGHGHGPLNHSHRLRRSPIAEWPAGATPRPWGRCAVLPIDDDVPATLAQALDGGARCVIAILATTNSTRRSVETCTTAARQCLAAGARFLVADRTDVALACGATGVHLTSDSLPCDVAREMLGSDAIVGVAVATAADARRAAADGADFVTVAAGDASVVREVAETGLLDVVALTPCEAGEVQSLLAAGAFGVAVRPATT